MSNHETIGLCVVWIGVLLYSRAEQCNLTNLTCQTLLSLITMLQDKLLGFVASSNQTPDSGLFLFREITALGGISVGFLLLNAPFLCQYLCVMLINIGLNILSFSYICVILINMGQNILIFNFTCIILINMGLNIFCFTCIILINMGLNILSFSYICVILINMGQNILILPVLY